MGEARRFDLQRAGRRLHPSERRFARVIDPAIQRALDLLARAETAPNTVERRRLHDLAKALFDEIEAVAAGVGSLRGAAEFRARLNALEVTA